LLFLSNKVMPSGLGNQNALVGRFFMEHPHLKSSVLLLSNPERAVGLYQRHRVDNIQIYGTLTMAEQVLREEKMAGSSAALTATKGDRYEKANGSEEAP